MHKTARELMSKSFYIVDIRSNISKAINLLAKKDVSCILVTEKRKDNAIAGIITERDLIRKLLLKKKTKAKIKYVMTPKVIVISPNDDLLYIQRSMAENEIKHLPVVEDGNIIGLVKQEHVAQEVHAIAAKNKIFMMYQNAQTIIILVFLIFLVIFFFVRMFR